MDWWNSFETVSKIQTALAVLVTVFGFITLTFKIRGDQLKRVGDKAKADERAKVDEALKRKTAEAAELETRLTQQQDLEKEQQKEKERVGSLQRHFPKEKTPLFLNIAAEGLSQTVTIYVQHLKSDDAEPAQFALEIAKVFDPSCDKTAEASVVNGAPVGITIVESTDTEAPSKAASNVQRAFEAVGLKCGYSKASAIDKGAVCIFVGKRE